MARVLTFIALLSVIVFVSGCPKLVKTKPSTKFSQDALVTRINSYLQNRQMAYYCAMTGHHVNYNFADFSYEKVYSCGSLRNSDGHLADEDKAVAKRVRDEALENGIAAVNSVYFDFVDDLNSGRSTANFVADIIDLGTSAAIGISKGERPLQILGVALTAFRGGRKSADLNFFREQSTPILINKMDDNRAIVYASILLKKGRSAEAYPIAEAIRDIVDYYNAGTLVRAFTQLSKDTAAKALESEKKVLQLQKIDPTDVVTIDDVDSHSEYIDLRQQYSAIFADGGTASATDKINAANSARLIFKAISADAALKPAVAAAKIEFPEFAADMDKLAGSDAGVAEQVAGPRVISIINKVYGRIDLKTGGPLVKNLIDHFKANPIKKD